MELLNGSKVMSSINKLENKVEGWLKPLPHLPLAGQKWLAENVWWIVLVGLILSVIGALILIGALVSILPIILMTSGYAGYYGGSSYNLFWIVGSLVSLVFMFATIILTAMAISPLRQLKKKGWNLLFITLIVSGLSTVVNAIINFNLFSFIPSIIFGAIGLAIGAYFLYEIRSYFKVEAKVVEKK